MVSSFQSGHLGQTPQMSPIPAPDPFATSPQPQAPEPGAHYVCNGVPRDRPRQPLYRHRSPDTSRNKAAKGSESQTGSLLGLLDVRAAGVSSIDDIRV